MKIYHYTSIDTLALILKNKTLRFNNAKFVNDPTEAMTEDFGSMQDYVFISCWSSEEKESIPLWKIYGADGHGVRLESDTKYIHFEGEETPLNGIYKVIENVKKEVDSDYFINVWQLNRPSINHYFETNYSDEERIFMKDASTETQQCWEYQVDTAFNTKATCWSFEKEIRFILLGCSLESYQATNNWLLVFNNITKKKNINSSFVDLILFDDFFNNLTVTTGPLQSESEKIIVQSLVQKYNQNIKVLESKLQLRK
jgi:hypothetical protein